MAQHPETIWRKEFDPELINIPRSEYSDYMPCVRVIPLAVDDYVVSKMDEEHSFALTKLYGELQQIIRAYPPQGISISPSQLIIQMPQILSGRSGTLQIRRGRKVIKTIPINARIRELCRAISQINNERLLLFEDLRRDGFRPTSAIDVEGYTLEKTRYMDLLIKSDKIKSITTLSEDYSLPIRLTPTATTCRVPPVSRVKLGIGWSRGVPRDAEQ